MPSTFGGAKTAQLAGAADDHGGRQAQTVTTQTIPVGPVAAMVAIKQLGTNGGGWYGPNSSVPLENPTPLSNLIECISIILIPVSLIFALGTFLRRPRFGVTMLGVMSLLCAGLTFGTVLIRARTQRGPRRAGRVPVPTWKARKCASAPTPPRCGSSLTTSTSNGSVNGMHDSFTPLGGLIPQINMFLNDIYGGIGVGFLNMFVFVVLTVFIAGLMVGRTPEIFGRKIEVREMKIASLVILLQPLLILGLSAVSLSVPSLTANLNPGFHGLVAGALRLQLDVCQQRLGLRRPRHRQQRLVQRRRRLRADSGPLPADLRAAGDCRTAQRRRRPRPKPAAPCGSIRPIFAATLLTVMLLLQLLNFGPALVLGGISEQLVGKRQPLQPAASSPALPNGVQAQLSRGTK